MMSDSVTAASLRFVFQNKHEELSCLVANSKHTFPPLVKLEQEPFISTYYVPSGYIERLI